MDERITEVIEYALGLEREARDLYLKVAEKVTDPDLTIAFRALAHVEESHLQRLEALLAGDFSQVSRAKNPVFNTSSLPYLSQVDREVFAVAVAEETRAVELYDGLAEAAEEPQMKRLFQAIAAEEREHQSYFQHLVEAFDARG